jgi:fructose-bisphosphate aldolase, class II
MKTYREYIQEVHEKGVAIGHFNVANSEALAAVYNAAKELDVPVIVGLSEGERDFFGIDAAVAAVKSIREKDDFPIFINADHTYSVERCKEAIDAGFDSVIYDGAKLSFEENLENTKAVVDYARASGRDVLIESELGFIGTSSKVLEELPEGAEVTDELMTKPEEAERFVKETGIDLLAPALGNVHGMLKGGFNPNLNADLTKEITEKTGVPLVLHGGSGSRPDDFVKVIKSGVSIVHISTELRVAFRKGLEEKMEEKPDEIAPYRYMNGGVEAMQAAVSTKLKLFNNL